LAPDQARQRGGEVAWWRREAGRRRFRNRLSRQHNRFFSRLIARIADEARSLLGRDAELFGQLRGYLIGWAALPALDLADCLCCAAHALGERILGEPVFLPQLLEPAPKRGWVIHARPSKGILLLVHVLYLLTPAGGYGLRM
jgi:hypothetical protein